MITFENSRRLLQKSWEGCPFLPATRWTSLLTLFGLRPPQNSQVTKHASRSA